MCRPSYGPHHLLSATVYPRPAPGTCARVSANGARTSARPYAGPMDMDGMSDVGLGIDVGGTGVKAALVELASGELLTSRVKLLTPDPATPEAVAATIGEVID